MEYVQELENLKEEINKSGKRIEDLSGLMENFSELNNIQQALKGFQEDNVLSRIESKIDIIAQADSIEIVKLIIDELNDDITQKYSDLSSKIDSLEDVNQQIITFLGEKKSQSVFLNEEKSEELNEIKKGIRLIYSNYQHFLENINSIQKVIVDYKSNEIQLESIPHFADELKTSLLNVDRDGLFDLENSINALPDLVKNLENDFLSGLSDLDAKVSNINENLANFNNIDENLESVRQRIDSIAQTLKNSGIESLYEHLYPIQNLQAVNEGFASAQEKLNIIIENLNNNNMDSGLEGFHAKINTKIAEEVNSAREILNESLEKINNSIKYSNESGDLLKNNIKYLSLNADSIKDLLDRIINLNNNDQEKTENNFEELKNALSYINGEVQQVKDSLYDLQSVATLNDNFQVAQDKLNILVEAIGNHSPECIKNELDLENSFKNIRLQIDNQVVNNLSSIKECLGEIQGKQNDVEEIKNAVQFLKHALEEINENLKYSAKNNIPEEILQTLLNNVNAVKELTSINLKNAGINEISSQINELDQKISGLQQISQFSESMGFIKENLCQLEEKFNYTNEKISEFANFTEKKSGEEISGVKDQLRSINEELNYKIDDNANNINRFLQEFSGKVENLGNIEGVDSLKEGLSILSSSFESVSNNVSALCEEVHSLSDIREKVENISNSVKIADTYEEINEINRKIDSLTDEIRSYRQNLASLPQNTGEQEYTEILSRLDEITKAVSSQNTGLDSIEEKISGEFGSLGSNIQEVKNRIEDLNNSLSDLKEAGSNEETEASLEKGLDEIKELSSLVSNDVSGLKNVMSDLFDAIAGMDNADSQDLMRQKLEQAIERIEQAINNTKPDFEELKSSSNNLSERLEGLTTDLSGLSEQTRDKLDKFFELSRNIESKIGDSSLNTEELLDSIKKLSDMGENQFSATSQSIDGLKREFTTIGEGLQEFDRDLTDINSKINKLIINSNDNTEDLKDKINNSLDSLGENIKQNLRDNAMSLSRTSKTQLGELSGNLAEISQKIEGLSSMSVKGLNSSDTLREAILQMAEWIDSAGQLLEENNESVRKSLDTTDNVLKTVSDSRKNILSQVDRVYNKFEDFEVRLESIEAKIERATEKDNNGEIKQMITDLKGKLPSQSGKKKENTQLLDKIDKLETQMVLFETKIQKVLEFVEQKKV